MRPWVVGFAIGGVMAMYSAADQAGLLRAAAMTIIVLLACIAWGTGAPPVTVRSPQRGGGE